MLVRYITKENGNVLEKEVHTLEELELVGKASYKNNITIEMNGEEYIRSTVYDEVNNISISYNTIDGISHNINAVNIEQAIHALEEITEDTTAINLDISGGLYNTLR